MKVILTSPDALIDFEEHEFFPGVAEVLDKLQEEGKIKGTIVVSSDVYKLRGIPKKFNPIQVSRAAKQGTGFVNIIVEKLPEVAAHHDLMVLGANDGDLRMSANSKLLLFSAQFAQKNNPDSSVFDYGVNITTPQDFYNFIDLFHGIGEQCFFELEVDENTWLYSITNANSFYEEDRRLKVIREKMKDFLKNHAIEYGDLFNYYFLMSLYTKVKALRRIDYWCVYPSSKRYSYNQDVLLLKEQARKIFKCKTSDEIFIRVSDSPKRSEMEQMMRERDGCNSQFDTIILNDVYRKKIKGKTICVIDDFTTYGSSCETARVLLLTAGAAAVVFVTIGKYGNVYIKHDYQIQGDVFEPGYRYIRKSAPLKLYGTRNRSADREIKNILGGIAR